jgi:hypothetical protein
MFQSSALAWRNVQPSYLSTSTETVHANEELPRVCRNFNYGKCGKAIGVDILNNPGLVSQDAVVAWKAALWFWTTAQAPRPSADAVMSGTWTPSQADVAAGRRPGFGQTINIVNGVIECGPSASAIGAKEAADLLSTYGA